MKKIIRPETLLKAKILTHGIIFSEGALKFAVESNAKIQNAVYNMPINSVDTRPQELIIKNCGDAYETVVSCVAPVKSRSPIEIFFENEKLIAVHEGNVINDVEINFVTEPDYYKKFLSNGLDVKKFVSACGLDELNIFPWKGCAISKCCKFCGVNNFIRADDLSAHKISPQVWNNLRKNYLENLSEAVSIAAKSDCYAEHLHVILISGNLPDELLNLQADIFADIARKIEPILRDKSTEGLILVITPPNDIERLKKLRDAGISKVVFNLEAIQPEYFKNFCPGKNILGYKFFIERLDAAVKIFGRGNTWSNLVFGLESAEESLRLCGKMADKGVVMSANVLHMDTGNRLNCEVPNFDATINFFFELEKINSAHGFKPYYCAKALRTSLTNEAHDGRIL